MRTFDLMKDPFYAKLLFEIEGKIHRKDALAKSQGITLTDSQVRSVIKKMFRVAQGKSNAPTKNIDAKEQILEELYQEILMFSSNLLERQIHTDGSHQDTRLSTQDWLKALEVLNESIKIRTTTEFASRSYLEFLAGFILQAGGKLSIDS